MSQDNMPELPAPFRVEQPEFMEPIGLWTARQVLDYAEHRVTAERDAILRLCDEVPADGLIDAIRARSGAQS